MDTVAAAPTLYRFEDFRLDTQNRQLSRIGVTGAAVAVPLGARALDILTILVERGDQIVSKAQIMDAVWPGLAVEDSNLTVQISALRRGVDLGRNGTSLIQTVHGRGYVLTAPAIRPAAGIPASPCFTIPGAQSQSGPAMPRLPRLSVMVVVPLNPRAPEKQSDLAEQIADDIMADLSPWGVTLIGDAETPFHRGASPGRRDRAEEGGIGYVIQVRVRGTAERASVNIQMVRVGTRVQLWSEKFDVNFAGAAEVADEQIHRLAWTLFMRLTEDVHRCIEAVPPEDWTPNDFVDRGRALLARPATRENRRVALQSFEQAVALGSRSVAARIGLAACLVSGLANAWSQAAEQDEARAEELLLDVLGSGIDIPEARMWLGVLRRVQGRFTESQIELEIAIALAPNGAFALSQLGATLAFSGQPEKAIEYIDRSLRLAPLDALSLVNLCSLGLCNLLLYRIDEAEICLTRARAENPRVWPCHWLLAAAQGLKGDLTEAAASLERAKEVIRETTSPNALRDLVRRQTSHPQYVALANKTVRIGLRRAGLTDD